jgi:hypothetical protein
MGLKVDLKSINNIRPYMFGINYGERYELLGDAYY